MGMARGTELGVGKIGFFYLDIDLCITGVIQGAPRIPTVLKKTESQ